MNMRKIGVLLLACFSLTASVVRAEFRIVGTDLLGADFLKSLYAAAGRHGLEVAIAFDGSRPGVEALKSGRADLALLVLPEEEKDAFAEFHAEPLAYHRVVVLVPASCPVQRISLAQLATIFGGRGGSPVNTWGDLGATGEWSASSVVAIAPVTGAGVVLEYFRHLALGGGELRANIARYENVDELRARLVGESRTMALASFVPENAATMRPLAVSARPNGPAFLPTAETLHAGEYPLRLTLRLVAREERLVPLRPLVEWLRSEEAARAFERAGVVPLPVTARRATR